MGVLVRLKPITMRRVMAWVAVVAIVMAAWKVQSRRAYYQRRAQEHAEVEAAHKQHIARVARLDRPALKAARLASLTGLAIALRPGGRHAIAGTNEGEGTIVVRDCGSDAAGLSVVDPASLREFDGRAAAPESEDEEFREAHMEEAARFAQYHAKQRRKYERAASRPWLPVSPDSPPQ